MVRKVIYPVIASLVLSCSTAQEVETPLEGNNYSYTQGRVINPNTPSGELELITGESPEGIKTLEQFRDYIGRHPSKEETIRTIFEEIYTAEELREEENKGRREIYKEIASGHHVSSHRARVKLEKCGCIGE